MSIHVCARLPPVTYSVQGVYCYAYRDLQSDAVHHEPAAELSMATSNPKRSAALFLLKTREEGRLTQTALDQVVHSTADLCQQVVSAIKEQVSEAIKQIGLPEAEQKLVLDKMEAVKCDPFDELRSEYMQGKYYKEAFKYLVSINWTILQSNINSQIALMV